MLPSNEPIKAYRIISFLFWLPYWLFSNNSDPSIKALIVDIDSKRHDIIIEELDDTNLLVSSDKVQFIKAELDRVLAKNTYNSLEEEEKEMQWLSNLVIEWTMTGQLLANAHHDNQCYDDWDVFDWRTLIGWLSLPFQQNKKKKKKKIVFHRRDTVFTANERKEVTLRSQHLNA